MLDKRPLELFLKWDAAQVLQYVHLVLPADERAAAAAFLEHNVDGALLPHLTLDHLKEIGVALLHLRLVIKKHISELIAHHHQRHPAKLFGDIDAGVAGALLVIVAPPPPPATATATTTTPPRARRSTRSRKRT